MQFNVQKAFTSLTVLAPILKREISESAQINIFKLEYFKD